MALETETQSIVEQFEYSDDDVNKAVKEFLRQAGTCLNSAFALGLLPSLT
jgi:hypothetical protein